MRVFARVMLSLALVLAVSAVSAHAQQAGSWNEQSVRATTQSWAQMMGTADVAALEQLLDADYQHIHGTGRVESKAQFLNAFTTGARRYAPLHLEGVSVRMFGSFAIVNGTFALKAYVGDKVLEGVNRFGLVIVPTPAGNKIIAFQATALPKQ